MALTRAGFLHTVARPSIEARNKPVVPGTKVYKLRLLSPFAGMKGGEEMVVYGCELDDMKRAGLRFDSRKVEVVGSASGDPLLDGVTFRFTHNIVKDERGERVEYLSARVGAIAAENRAVPPIEPVPEDEVPVSKRAAIDDLEAENPPKRGRGRPRGSRNKPKEDEE